MTRTLAVALVAGLFFVGACRGGTPAKVIRIGVELPLSGAEGRVGQTALNGVRFFVDQHPTIGGLPEHAGGRDDALARARRPGPGEPPHRTLRARTRGAGLW